MVKKNRLYRCVSILFLFVLIVISVFCNTAAVKAFTGTYFGRGNWYGYFTNTYDPWPGSGSDYNYVLPIVKDNLALPGDTINSVDSLLTLLKDYNADNTQTFKAKQAKTGSAFIVNTMLGKSALYPPDLSATSKDISADDWSDLESRLDYAQGQGNIIWSDAVSNYNGGDCINSVYQGYGANDSNSINPDDDAFFSNSGSCHTESGIKILNDDHTTAYLLLRRCANPIGQIANSGLSRAKWVISPTSTISVNGVIAVDQSNAKAVPGNTITWAHTVTNNEYNTHPYIIQYHYQNRGDWVAEGGVLQASVFATNETKSFNSQYTIQQGDVGKRLCRATSAQPSAWDNTGWVESSSPCVKVEAGEFTLTPAITTNPNGILEAGSYFEIIPTVTNSNQTQGNTAVWQLKRIIGSSVTPMYSRPDSFPANSTTNLSTFTPIAAEAAPDLAVGTRVCYELSVAPYSNTTGNNSATAEACIIIGKKPKVQIWGGDLFSGGKIQTSTSFIRSNTFGSWIEYGVFAVDKISGFGSGSAYANNMTGNFCDASKLSFANVLKNSPSCSGTDSVGNYTRSSSLPDVAASFPSSAGTHMLNGSNGAYNPSAGGPITGGAMGIGQWAVINATGKGTVQITGNINYTAANISSVSDIPQVVIIADNIEISGNVTNIDAWLIAKNGYINTCSDVAFDANLSSEICNNPLRINGPVIAKNLYLRRTAGSRPGATGEPAEIFNLRADAYLWAATHAKNNNVIQTVYSAEMPPRF